VGSNNLFRRRGRTGGLHARALKKDARRPVGKETREGQERDTRVCVPGIITRSPVGHCCHANH